jgi:hypothetical protein
LLLALTPSTSSNFAPKVQEILSEMRKLFLATIIVVATFSVAAAQDAGSSSSKQSDIPNMGRAPSQPNGIGRLDARVFDEAGNPVRGAYLKLESERTDGFFCESWNSTDERGVSVLPPLHMGNLKLIVKAKGYETLKLNVPADNLNEPLRVTLVKKK